MTIDAIMTAPLLPHPPYNRQDLSELWAPLSDVHAQVVLLKQVTETTAKPLTGEGLVERFMSILWSGTLSCQQRPSRSSTPDVPSSEFVRLPQYFLDRARVSCGGEYDDDEVDIVRDIMMTVPVFLTLIVFSAFTSQVRTFASFARLCCQILTMRFHSLNHAKGTMWKVFMSTIFDVINLLFLNIFWISFTRVGDFVQELNLLITLPRQISPCSLVRSIVWIKSGTRR